MPPINTQTPTVTTTPIIKNNAKGLTILAIVGLMILVAALSSVITYVLATKNNTSNLTETVTPTPVITSVIPTTITITTTAPTVIVSPIPTAYRDSKYNIGLTIPNGYKAIYRGNILSIVPTNFVYTGDDNYRYGTEFNTGGALDFTPPTNGRGYPGLCGGGFDGCVESNFSQPIVINGKTYTLNITKYAITSKESLKNTDPSLYNMIQLGTFYNAGLTDVDKIRPNTLQYINIQAKGDAEFNTYIDILKSLTF